MANSARRRRLGIGVVGALLCLFGGLFALVAAHADPAGLSWSAAIRDRETTEIDSNAPLALGDQETVRATIRLTNSGTETVRIRSVRLEGQVIGLTFFSFSVAVGIELPPGPEVARRVDFDLADLADQANGLIPTKLSLIGPDRQVLREIAFPVDVKGSPVATYRVFGAAIASATLVLLASLLFSIRRGYLPRNRWERALRFVTVGLGLGLTLTFSLSTFGLLVPNPSRWVSLVAGFGVVAFLIGYFLPMPHDDDHPTRAYAGSGTGSSNPADW